MRVSSKVEAVEYYYQLVNSESTFSDLARTAEGFEKDTNGLIGPVPGKPHPLIQNRLVFSNQRSDRTLLLWRVVEYFKTGTSKGSDYGFAIENKLCMELLGH